MTAPGLSPWPKPPSPLGTAEILSARIRGGRF